MANKATVFLRHLIITQAKNCQNKQTAHNESSDKEKDGHLCAASDQRKDRRPLDIREETIRQILYKRLHCNAKARAAKKLLCPGTSYIAGRTIRQDAEALLGEASQGKQDKRSP